VPPSLHLRLADGSIGLSGTTKGLRRNITSFIT
jgi:hypothetical protein